MDIEAIGVITLIVGFMVLRLGPAFGMYALATASVFGAAAAVKLPALEGASIPPAALILLFLSAAALANGAWRRAALANLAFPQPGFWFLALVVYGLLSAFFLPRIFSGLTHVYAIARSGDQFGFVTLPLAPRAGNITQTLYFCGNLACFAAVAGYARLGGGPIVVRALLTAAVLTLAFALADLLTYATGTQEILSFIRNANYRMLDSTEIGGFKRIVGSFSEAGAYSYAALGFYAFTLGLWLGDHPTRFAAPLAGLLLVTLLLSTSTTAYASLALFSLAVLFACLWSLFAGQASRRQVGYLFALAFIVPLLLLGAMLTPQIWAAASGLFDAVVVNKLDSQSGVERMRWNAQALVSFLETAGFGAGLGSVRTSSFLIAILANLGIPGLLLFAPFLAGVALPPRRRTAARFGNGTGGAAAAACLALLIAASLAATTVDLGLAFSMFAALSAASRDRDPATLRPGAETAPPLISPVMVRPI